MTEVSKRVLIVGPAWVGDMVMAQSLFMTLKESDPAVSIDVLAPAWSEPLLARMPEINNAIVMPVGHGQFSLKIRYSLGKQLRSRHYDQAIVIPRSFKAALAPFAARIPQRTGYRGEMRYGLINDMRPLDKSVLTQTVQRYVALGLGMDAPLPPAKIPYPKLRVDEANRDALMNRLQLELDKPVIAMMPGAEYGPSKRWPATHYAQLAKILVNRGKQVWIFGSSKDRSIGDEITLLANSDAVRNLCGKTRLEDVIDLMSLSSVAVTNDSGLMHIASSLGRKVLAIYGSSSPSYTPPLSDDAVIKYMDLECSPCFKRACPLGHTNCLNEINVDDIYKSIQLL